MAGRKRPCVAARQIRVILIHFQGFCLFIYLFTYLLFFFSFQGAQECGGADHGAGARASDVRGQSPRLHRGKHPAKERPAVWLTRAVIQK